MRGTLLTIVWLTVVWVALWEELSVGNVVAGLLVALAVVSIAPVSRSGLHAFRVLPALRFLGYFVWKLVEASAIVAWEVVTPRERINEGIVAIPIRGVSNMVTTIVANAISLTPGTLTLEVHQNPTVLYVHVLHLHDIEQVRREVLHLEALVVRAFGSAEAVGQLAHTDGEATAPTASQAFDQITEEDRR